MPEPFLQWGGDLQASSTGDLLLTDGSQESEQRVLRRLLTNAGDYIWHVNYGAGIGQFVGRPAVQDEIVASIQSQMLLEASVAPLPPPSVTVDIETGGIVEAQIQYVNSNIGASQTLSFSVSS